MHFLGFTDETIKLFTSYLSNRKFIIIIENSSSDKASITWCIISFNIWSTALFNYINDMPQAVDFELLLYADDTGLVFEHRYIKTIEEHLKQDISTLVDWFVDYKPSKLTFWWGQNKIDSLFSKTNRNQ